MTGVLNIDATGTALSVPNGDINLGGDINLSNQKGLHVLNGDASSIMDFDFPELTTANGTFRVGRLTPTTGLLNTVFQYGGATAVIIEHKSARLGINTTNPQAKLDVNGDLRTHSLIEKSKNGSVSGGSYFLIWGSYGNHDIILTQNTEILQGDIPPVGYSQVITLNVIGDFALTLPTEWVIKNGGTYDGVNGSQIVVQSWDNGNFYTVIN